MLHFTSQIPAINNSHSNYNSQDHHDSYHQSSHHNNAINGVVGDDAERMSSSMSHNLNRNSGLQNHRISDIARKPIKYVLCSLSYPNFINLTIPLLQGKTYTLISIKAI